MASAQQVQCRVAPRAARHTDPNTSTSSVSSAATLLNGSVGAILTSVKVATQDSAKETTLANYLSTNCPSAREVQNVL